MEELDGKRAGKLMFYFFKRRQSSLTGPDLDATTLDGKYDRATSDLCRRIAADVDLEFDAERREVRALLSRRIVLLLVNTWMRSERWEVLRNLGPCDNRTATALIFRRVLAKMYLPAAQDGERFSASRPGWMN